MKYNVTIKTTQVEDWKESFDLLRESGYGSLNQDAVWKWAAIHSAAKSLGLLDAPFKAIDAGGGLSPLHFLFSNHGTTYNVDMIHFNSTWFPTNRNRFFKGSKGLPHNEKNIHYVRSDFIEYLKTLPNDTIDFVYDACSIIHFTGTKFERPQMDGFDAIMREIKRVLRPGGFFIGTSDLMHPKCEEVREFLYVEKMEEAFAKSGLKYYDTPDWELEDFFLDLEHSHFKTGGPAYYKNTERQCGKCKGLPFYHLFMDNTVPDLNTLIRSRFVLQKQD